MAVSGSLNRISSRKKLGARCKVGIFKKFSRSENRHIYYIDYYDENGKRVRESTGASAATFAKELLIKRKDEVSMRKKLPDRYISPVNFSEFVDNEYLPIHAKGQKTVKDTIRICNKLKAFFGHKFLHEIDSRMVEEYKKNLLGKVADNTINNELNTLKGIFTKAIDWGKASVNPVRKVKLFRTTARRRILDREEQAALIFESGQERKAPLLQDMVILDLNIGLRKSELLNIKKTDIDFENGTLHVRAEIAKYSKYRYIDLNKHALNVLRKSLSRKGAYVFCGRNGQPVKDFVRAFRSAAKRAGLIDITIHDLRRTFGSNCVMDGVDLATVQAWMGHASIETTIKHYAHLVKSHRKEEIKKIEGRMDTYMDTTLNTV